MLNRHRQLTVALCAALGLASAAPILAGPTGREIMAEQDQRHGSRYELVLEKMTLVDKKGREEARQVRTYTRELEADESRTLIAFLDPRDIKGTALLTWQHADRDDDQWLYLPARGKMQRIAKGGRKNYFMGTDFTYEDLEPETLADYNYTLVREEEVDGSTCHVIEAVPADADKLKASGYSKRVLWVSKENLTTLKVEFYDRRDKLIKTQSNRAWKNVSADLWRADESVMDNHKTRHKTVIQVTERSVDEEIAEQTFTERFVLKGRHVR